MAAVKHWPSSTRYGLSIGANIPKNLTQAKSPCAVQFVGDWGQWRSRSTTSTRSVAVSPQLLVLAASTVQTAPADVFPAFLPPAVQFVKEPAARYMASKIQHLPVQTSLSKQPILTSCVAPSIQGTDKLPVLLVHGFDSSLLEWRRLYPLLEADGVETWAIDILGWGFSNTEGVTSFGVAAKREHLYEFWKAHVKKPMVLVGASLGGSITIDFAVAHPHAVAKLVLIDAQGFAEGVGNMATIPKFLAYAGVTLQNPQVIEEVYSLKPLLFTILFDRYGSPLFQNLFMHVAGI